MSSITALIRKSRTLRTVYKISKSILTADDKNGSAIKVGVGAPNVKVEVEIDKLRTPRNHPYRQEYIDQGVAFFDLAVSESPHHQFIRAYQNDPELRIENTGYWRLADFALKIHRERVGGDYIHNQRRVVESATQMCNEFVKLYDKIKAEGFSGSIEVIAAHDGKYLINDGIHRASILTSLGLKSIPVRIKSVDEGLSRLMEELRNTYPTIGQKTLYTPIAHPVFSDWQATRDSTRWQLIKDECDWQGTKLLDIGSYTGFFSHNIAGLGGCVTGIEADGERLAQAKLINGLLESNVEFIAADFFDYLQGKKFDAVLFFSVLHWILKERGLSGVREALDLISTASPILFFDMGQDNELKMRTQGWTHGLTINKETIPDLIVSNSKYKYFRHLGTGDTGRDVFKFTRMT